MLKWRQRYRPANISKGQRVKTQVPREKMIFVILLITTKTT